MLKVYRLFDPDQSPHQACCRRAALVKETRYLADPDLAKALSMLRVEMFNKMMSFLHSPKCKQVRTNNHVERTNRQLRYFEKVRYTPLPSAFCHLITAVLTPIPKNLVAAWEKSHASGVNGK